MKYKKNINTNNIIGYNNDSELGLEFYSDNWIDLTTEEIELVELQEVKNAKYLLLEKEYNKVQKILIKNEEIIFEYPLMGDKFRDLERIVIKSKEKGYSSLILYDINNNLYGAVKIYYELLYNIYQECDQISNYNFIQKQIYKNIIKNINNIKDINNLEFSQFYINKTIDINNICINILNTEGIKQEIKDWIKSKKKGNTFNILDKL